LFLFWHIVYLWCCTASALVWASNSVKHLPLHLFISLRTVLICWAAFGMDCRVLDWKRWGIAMLELDAVSSSLVAFSPDGFERSQRNQCYVPGADLPTSQCTCFAFRLSCFILLTCFAHVNLLPRCMPQLFEVHQHCPFALPDRFDFIE
jgi:hypothetical protein